MVKIYSRRARRIEAEIALFCHTGMLCHLAQAVSSLTKPFLGPTQAVGQERMSWGPCQETEDVPFTFGSAVGRSVSEHETSLCTVDILPTERKGSRWTY